MMLSCLVRATGHCQAKLHASHSITPIFTLRDPISCGLARNFRRILVLQKGQASGFAEKLKKFETEVVCIDYRSISANSQIPRVVISHYHASENIVTFRTVPVILELLAARLAATSQQETEERASAEIRRSESGSSAILLR